MEIRIISTLLLCLLSAGCGEMLAVDNAQIELRTDQNSYRVGEEGMLSLTNRHRNAIDVNRSIPTVGMSTLVQRRVAGEWEYHPHPSAVPLHLHYVTLDPGNTLARPFRTVDTVFRPGGEYRFVVGVRDRRTGEGSLKYSNSFTVEE